MNIFKLKISKNALRNLAFIACLTVLYTCFSSLIKLFLLSFKTVSITQIEAFLGILAYFSLVGLAFLILESYQKREWIFTLFSINPYPKMDFEEFKDEPQFEMRDWKETNEAVKTEIEKLKKLLGLESNTVFELENTMFLPSLFDSTKGQENETINQQQRRRKSFFDL